MRKTILSCIVSLALLSAASPAAALAQGAASDARREEVLARLNDARTKNRRVTIKFKNGASVTGRIGEVRERGFTFQPDGYDGEKTLSEQNAFAAVLYENIAAVEHPSKVKGFLKKVGYGFVLGGAAIIILPVYGVVAMLGQLPSC
jgi:hypothetical protein